MMKRIETLAFVISIYLIGPAVAIAAWMSTFAAAPLSAQSPRRLRWGPGSRGCRAAVPRS